MSVGHLLFNANCTDKIRVSFNEKEIVSFIDGCTYWLNDQGHFFLFNNYKYRYSRIQFLYNQLIISDNRHKRAINWRRVVWKIKIIKKQKETDLYLLQQYRFFMFEKIVQKLINRILGEYVQDFNSQNLNIGIWSGEVVVQSVRLKKDIIKRFNLPFNIKYSRLGCVRMNIPWSSLSSSKIEVSVQGLQLLITQIPEQFWECKNQKIIQKRKKQIQSFCEGIIADFTKKSDKSSKENSEKEQGYISNMIVKIIDNIQVVVKDIHIRFQDQITKQFSFGVTLQQLKIYTVNKQGEPDFIDRTKKMYQNQPLRKKLFLSNLGVYWNQKSQFFKSPDPHQQMVESIYKKLKTKNEKKMNYILMMSFNAMLYVREAGKQFDEPQINLFIQFNELKIEITNNQLQQIITLGERFQRFKNEVRLQNRKKLTQLQMIANREVFLQLFPKYFQNSTTVKEVEEIEQILSKMEVQNFQEGIKKILQEKQKSKMIQQKKQKSKGWFSGPKELNQQQILQIQNFIENNFGKQTKIFKRPQSFYYIKVNFNLNLLQVVIANESGRLRTKEGIRFSVIDIKMEFCLRQSGYKLNFAMNSINAELFKAKYNEECKNIQQNSFLAQNHSPNEEIINIIQAIKSEEWAGRPRQYVRLEVLGNPLNKKEIDTQIIVRTEQLLVQLHPQIIRVVKDFIDIKLNTQNSQAALQAYGQLKNIASNAANQSLKKPLQKKNFISLDAKISAISVILFFSPQKINQDIWVLKIGNTKIYSDSQILKITEYTYDEPMQKYGLRFEDMSFMHFQSKKAYFSSRNIGVSIPNFNPKNTHKILNDLDIELQLQLFKESKQNIPKIRVKTTLHNIDVQLDSFVYESIQKIDSCFKLAQLGESERNSEVNKKEKEKMISKAEIMKQAKKIGIIYEQSKQLKKYIAVLNGNYLYLYKDKKDIEYSQYYYLKNCEATYNNEPSAPNKPYQVQFHNSVNTVVLGFDKPQQMEEWVKAVKQINEYQEQFKSLIQQKKQIKINKKSSSKLISPDNLTAQICANIQKLTINTIFNDKKKLQISIKSLQSLIKVHQAKNVLDFSLQSIQLSDNIYMYKNKELNNLLQTTPVPGRQRLIYVNIINYALTHPKYDNIVATINVEFGKLICNYKPETMQRVMNFYIPKDNRVLEKRKEKGQDLTFEQKKILQKQKKELKRQIIQNQLKKGLAQTFLLKINLKIQQISASLVNRYNRVMIARLGLTGFSYSFAMSSRRMVMNGKLKEMWFADYSNYPHTIYEERQQYKSVHYIVQSYSNSRDMVSFSVQLLQIPNNEDKSMFIKVSLYDLKVSYIQQPVLRFINYLLEQILPSLTPPEDLSQSIQVPKNDMKPTISTMVLFAQIQNVLALVEPRSNEYPNQFLQLNVSKIEVRNSSAYRDYIKNRQKNEELVLTQNYSIEMSSIKILQKFNKRQTSLTNDLNFKVSCDLIQNPMYYRKLYKDRFDPGMRIQCELSPFLFCINHVDYNFIMKCLYWNIIYDDNAEGYFSRLGNTRQQTIATHAPVSQPINFGLSMSKIILCVTENNFPISILLLNQMRYDLTLDQTGMYMIFKMKHLCGTTIQRCSGDPKLSIEKGMFNSFGYKKVHNTQNLLTIPKLVQSFSNNQLTKISAYTKQQFAIIFKMCTISEKNESIITLNIKDIKIAIELKILLTLSKLALIEEYIQPPKSSIKPIHKKVDVENAGNIMGIQIQMQNFVGCVGDKNLQNFFVMQGIFHINLKLHPSKSEQKIIQQSKSIQNNSKIREISSYMLKIYKYSLYYCSNIHTLQNKRYILKPFTLLLILNQSYCKVKETILSQTEIDGMIDHVTMECSIRDLLVINRILQQYLQILNQVNRSSQDSKIQQTRLSKMAKMEKQQEIEPEQKMIEIKSTKMNFAEHKIKSKTIGTVKLQPLQFRVVNDCGNNFMPVLNFFMDESCLMYNGSFIKKQISYNLGMKLDFFNPRSASWQPIIETYLMSFQYSTHLTEFGDKVRINISSSEQQQLKELKFNISTQLILTLLATAQLAKKELKNLSPIFKPIQSDIVRNEAVKIQTTEISPYYLQNRTICPITIIRTIAGMKADKQLQPQFKGQVRMDQISQILRFSYKGREYQVNMQKYGYVSVPKLNDVHLEFKVNKLNRIISFVDKYTIKNCTGFKLYCQRLDETGQKIQQHLIQVNPQDLIPFKADWLAQFSFNMKTFTYPHSIKNLTKMTTIQAESSRFQFNISQKRSIHDHFVINLRAPYIIQNCLPKNIQFQFINNGKHLSTRQILAQTSHQVFANEDINNLKFKIIAEGFYWSQQFWLDHTKLGKENQLIMNDRQMGFTFIKYIFEFNEQKNQIKLSIFCPAYIISQLDEDMIIYGNLQRDQKNKSIEKYQRIAGQSQYWLKNNQQQKQEVKRNIDKITIIGSQIGSKLRICGSNCIIDFSEPFNISSIGIHQARVVVQRQVGLKKMGVFIMLGIEIALKKMTLTSNIISKQITIRHRYIIMNKSNHLFLIKEEGSQKLSFYVEKGEKKPFFYTIPSIGSQARNMILKTPDTKQSFPLPSNALGILYFRLELKDKKQEFLYFKINTQQIDSYIFYEIIQVSYNDLPYQAIVKSSKIRVYVPLFEKILTKDCDPLLFINQTTLTTFNLFILVNLIQTQQSEQVYVPTDNLNFVKVLRFLNKKNSLNETFRVSISFNDNRRFIIIEELSAVQQESEHQLQSIHVKLEKLSFSFIQNHAQIQNPYQSFYFYFYNLQLISLKSNLLTRYQARLQFLQFDQQEPFNVPDPVIVTAHRFKQYMSQQKQSRAIFNALIEIDNRFVRNFFINLVKIQINDIVVRATTYFIKIVMSLMKQYNYVFRNQNQFFISRKVDTWKNIQLSDNDRQTFIKSIQIAPFTIQITAQVRLNELDIESVVFFGTIINALGVVITNIENAPIKFDGIDISNCIDTVGGIQQKLLAHYKSSVMKQLYKVFGSLNIIGNPVSLFKNISAGVKALQQKPAEGFVKGPLQFGLGIANGTSSLIALSVGGALNSVEKVTGTIASGLAVLTFDKQFQEARQKEKMRRPKHLLEGLQKGGKAIFHGFKEGITGVVTKPIEKTKQEGFVGFFKGAAQGVTGLVVKPVTGVVDFASKTTEGLKNTTLYLQDKPNENRIRYPRVFYTECNVIREYNVTDSKLLSIISKTRYEDKYGFQNPTFMCSYLINSQQFLLVLKQYIIMIQIKNQRIDWAIPLQNVVIGKSEQSERHLKIFSTNRRQWYTKKVNASVEFQTKEDVINFMKLLEQLKVNISNEPEYQDID